VCAHIHRDVTEPIILLPAHPIRMKLPAATHAPNRCCIVTRRITRAVLTL
jgi:hypothetical protein